MTEQQEWSTDGLMRLLAAIYDPQWESRQAFRHMNKVLDDYKAGRASYQEYQTAWDEFERIARESGAMG